MDSPSGRRGGRIETPWKTVQRESDVIRRLTDVLVDPVTPSSRTLDVVATGKGSPAATIHRAQLLPKAAIRNIV
jgi:hypothetical protein